MGRSQGLRGAGGVALLRGAQRAHPLRGVAVGIMARRVEEQEHGLAPETGARLAADGEERRECYAGERAGPAQALRGAAAACRRDALRELRERQQGRAEEPRQHEVEVAVGDREEEGEELRHRREARRCEHPVRTLLAPRAQGRDGAPRQRRDERSARQPPRVEPGRRRVRLRKGGDVEARRGHQGIARGDREERAQAQREVGRFLRLEARVVPEGRHLRQGIEGEDPAPRREPADARASAVAPDPREGRGSRQREQGVRLAQQRAGEERPSRARAACARRAAHRTRTRRRARSSTARSRPRPRSAPGARRRSRRRAAPRRRARPSRGTATRPPASRARGAARSRRARRRGSSPKNARSSAIASMWSGA